MLTKEKVIERGFNLIMQAIEKKILKKCYDQTISNRENARRLKICPATLSTKIKQYNIQHKPHGSCKEGFKHV